MKCVRCSAELPGQAQFCLRCGTPVAAMQNSTVTMARPASSPIRSVSASNPNRSKTGLYLGIAAAIIVLAALGFGINSLMNKAGRTPGGSNVVDATGHAPGGSRITDTTGRVGNTAPLTTSAGTNETPLDPAPIIDYIAFLRQIEQKKVLLFKSNTGTVMHMIPELEAGNLGAAMQTNEDSITKTQNDTYGRVQSKISDISNQWLNLSAEFQKRTPPQACQQLANYYYDSLGKSSASIVTVLNSFSQAMQATSSGGDPGKASEIIEKLTSLGGRGSGSFSKQVDDACAKANAELQAVCDKFRIHKDFDITADPGGASPLGLGG